jgi:hypothetical protein
VGKADDDSRARGRSLRTEHLVDAAVLVDQASDQPGLVNRGRRAPSSLCVEEPPVPDGRVVVGADDFAVLDAEAGVTRQTLHRPGSVPSTPCSSRMRTTVPWSAANGAARRSMRVKRGSGSSGSRITSAAGMPRWRR